MLLSELTDGDRDLLLAHAALLTHADGKQTKGEEKLLKDLVEHLEIGADSAQQIIEQARERAEKLASRM